MMRDVSTYQTKEVNDMRKGELIRVAYENPYLRNKLLPLIQAHVAVEDRISKSASANKEAAKGLPISKLMKHAESGIFIVSAFRNQFSRRENKLRNEELRQRLLSLGVSESKIVRLNSGWLEEGHTTMTMEQSFAVLAPLPWRDCLAISNDYEQDGFIWSSRRNPLALYERKGTATFAVDERLAVSIEVQSNDQLYSKGRGGVSFDIGFNWDNPLRWDGNNPLTFDDVREALGA